MKISRPILYGGIGVLAIAAWMLTGEEPTQGVAKRRPAATSTSRAKGIVFTKEDLEARYVPVNAQLPNAFKPLVARTGAAGELIAPNAIPADFAGGDPNWVYSGMATVNGVGLTLVENSATGDGEFLKVNQKWKRATVLKMTPEILVMESERGVVRTMRVKTSDEILAPLPNEGLLPVNPLQGPIGDGIGNGNGDGIAVRPEGASPRPSTASPTESSNEN